MVDDPEALDAVYAIRTALRQAVGGIGQWDGQGFTNEDDRLIWTDASLPAHGPVRGGHPRRVERAVDRLRARTSTTPRSSAASSAARSARGIDRRSPRGWSDGRRPCPRSTPSAGIFFARAALLRGLALGPAAGTGPAAPPRSRRTRRPTARAGRAPGVRKWSRVPWFSRNSLKRKLSPSRSSPWSRISSARDSTSGSRPRWRPGPRRGIY